MSYKLKSLIYLTAFIASALIYDSVITEAPEDTAAKTSSVELKNAVTNTTDMDAQEDADFLEDTALNLNK